MVVQDVAPVAMSTQNLMFLSRLIYPYLGKDVVVMLDVETSAPYLVDASAVDLEGAPVQAVDTSTAMQPYLWEAELEKLVPNVETARLNILKSFLLAGAFDTDAVHTRVRNDMFNLACPYKKQFFVGE